MLPSTPVRGSGRLSKCAIVLDFDGVMCPVGDVPPYEVIDRANASEAVLALREELSGMEEDLFVCSQNLRVNIEKFDFPVEAVYAREVLSREERRRMRLMGRDRVSKRSVVNMLSSRYDHLYFVDDSEVEVNSVRGLPGVTVILVSSWEEEPTVYEALSVIRSLEGKRKPEYINLVG